MGTPRRKAFNGGCAAVERQLIGSPAASAAGLSDQFAANKSNFAELLIPQGHLRMRSWYTEVLRLSLISILDPSEARLSTTVAT